MLLLIFRFMGNQGDPVLLQNISTRIRQLREERNLTQRDVLTDTGILVSRIEMGKRDVSVSTISKLCQYFGITLEEFFKGIKS